MPQRRILYLDNACLTAYKTGGGEVVVEGRFLPDENGLQAFDDYLLQENRSLFVLLVDLPDEGFQVEDIPFSSGKDRAAIVTRKLGQFFYGTPYAIAQSQGRQKTGRRDERLLLMALTRPQSLDPWLGLLRARQAILTGIYSLPQIVEQLLPKQAVPQILLLAQTHAGLRQAFFLDRQLHFSRLTPLATGSGGESAMATAQEAEKMHQYLASQRLVDRNRALTVRVLANAAHMPALRSHCHDSARLQFEFADLPEEAKRLGMKPIPPNVFADVLFCHLVSRQPPREQFAPAAERQYFRLWQTRFALKAAAIGIFVAGLMFSAKQLVDFVQARDQIALLQEQVRNDQRSYEADMKSLPPIPISAENLKKLMERYALETRRAEGPRPLLVQLSRSLDAFPAIALERIDWMISDELNDKKAGGLPFGQVAVPPAMNAGPYAHAVVAAFLPVGMVANQRAQLGLVNDFIRHLGEAPDTLAVVLTPPVDTQSGKTLRSDDERRVAEPPRFTFRLTRKL